MYFTRNGDKFVHVGLSCTNMSPCPLRGSYCVVPQLGVAFFSGIRGLFVSILFFNCKVGYIDVRRSEPEGAVCFYGLFGWKHCCIYSGHFGADIYLLCFTNFHLVK